MKKYDALLMFIAFAATAAAFVAATIHDVAK